MEVVKEESAFNIMMKNSKKGRGKKASDIIAQPQAKVNPVEVFLEHRVRELLKGTKKLLTGEVQFF